MQLLLPVEIAATQRRLLRRLLTLAQLLATLALAATLALLSAILALALSNSGNFETVAPPGHQRNRYCPAKEQYLFFCYFRGLHKFELEKFGIVD